MSMIHGYFDFVKAHLFGPIEMGVTLPRTDSGIGAHDDPHDCIGTR
jgi:hypothetical protein